MLPSTGFEWLDHEVGPYAQAGWETNHIGLIDKRLEKEQDEDRRKELADQRKALLASNDPRDISASDRIAGHAMIGGLAPEAEGERLRASLGMGAGDARNPFDVQLGMGSKDERLKILGMMSQNGGGDMATSESRCGAATLLAGALLGGGDKGIGTLVKAVEEMAKKGGAVNEATKKQMAEMDALVAKMGKGGASSMGDLNKLQNDIFLMMNPAAKTDMMQGTSDEAVKKLFKSSPELAKLFKDNDLTYEAIDTNNGGQGGHAVLGIGHARGDKQKTGPHQMVFDPYLRRNLDPDAVADVKYKGQLQEDLEKDLLQARLDRDTGRVKDLEGAVERAKANREAAQAHEGGVERGTAEGWKPASQLITNPLEVTDYYKAERSHFGTDGMFHGDDHTKYVSPYHGLY